MLALVLTAGLVPGLGSTGSHLALSCATCAQATSPTSPAPPIKESSTIVAGKLATSLDDYLGRCEAFGFSGSVLIEKDGEIVLAKGYGLAERESHRPNTPDTIFDIGSLTKQFTATAILRLEQDGKLTTSDTLSKFLPRAPSDKAKIQLHHLLTHTSGLPRGIEGVGSEMQSRDALVQALFAAPLASKPGDAFRYSNVGYDLLGAVVEIASGQTYEEYVRTTLFAPSLMTSTGFRKDGRLAPESAARGYTSPWQPNLPGSTIQGETESRWEPSLATDGWYSWGLRGAGGVLTTVHDLRRWQQALDGTSVLKPAAKEKLFRPFKGDYAYGWYVLKTARGSPWIEHGGTTDNGFDCKFTRFPEHHAVIVVLGNVLGGTLPWVNLNVGKLVRGEEVPWPPAIAKLEAGAMASMEGTWGGTGDVRFQVSVQDEHVVLEALNASALAVLLPPSSPRAAAITKKTLEIAKDLGKNDFKSLHAAEDRAHPLGYFDDWWRRFEDRLGARGKITPIGVVSDPTQGDMSLLRVDYAKGAEILRFLWSGETLTGCRIGPPYPSRHELRPTATGAWIDFDLIASRVLVELRVPTGGTTRPERLELITNGKSSTLTKVGTGR